MLTAKPVITIAMAFLFVPADTVAGDQQQKLHPKIRAYYSDRMFSQTCQAPLFCSDMVSIDCGAAADGPYTYFDNTTGEVIMECGGACMLNDPNDPKDCKSCPPREWTCNSGY